MQRLPHQPLRARPKAERGIGIAEPLVLSVILAIVVGATAVVFNSINRQTITTRKQVEMQSSIDDNLRQIQVLARRFTCCAGTCTVTPPTTFGVVGAITQPCATNNPLDDRYYFPQVDLATTTANFPNTTTPSEPLAVEQLCRPENNTVFMTPFRTAVEALPQPVNATRATTIQPLKTLRVEFTDNNNSNRSVRVVFITPAMANYCP
jgi:type II secretory pathway pseudopilin PulG